MELRAEGSTDPVTRGRLTVDGSGSNRTAGRAHSCLRPHSNRIVGMRPGVSQYFAPVPGHARLEDGIHGRTIGSLILGLSASAKSPSARESAASLEGPRASVAAIEDVGAVVGSRRGVRCVRLRWKMGKFGYSPFSLAQRGGKCHMGKRSQVSVMSGEKVSRTADGHDTFSVRPVRVVADPFSACFSPRPRETFLTMKGALRPDEPTSESERSPG